MAMLAYLLGVLTSFVGPLVLWLLKKDQSKFVAYHALQACCCMPPLRSATSCPALLAVFLIGFITGPVFLDTRPGLQHPRRHGRQQGRLVRNPRHRQDEWTFQ